MLWSSRYESINQLEMQFTWDDGTVLHKSRIQENSLRRGELSPTLCLSTSHTMSEFPQKKELEWALLQMCTLIKM